jgi:hypothetical protein
MDLDGAIGRHGLLTHVRLGTFAGSRRKFVVRVAQITLSGNQAMIQG